MEKSVSSRLMALVGVTAVTFSAVRTRVIGISPASVEEYIYSFVAGFVGVLIVSGISYAIVERYRKFWLKNSVDVDLAENTLKGNLYASLITINVMSLLLMSIR
ncbi:MAG: hypothetical protein U1E20_00235 [Methylocystis sp.]|uniref:hypothetical protein n=1 Tax=Methylocystis sp. TaxID=1911079 RepID=UPI003921CC0C